MANMTREGKYKRGIELEQEGLSAQQIAERLGFENVQAWYSAKHYYSRRNASWAAKGEAEAEAREVQKAVDTKVDQKPEPAAKGTQADKQATEGTGADSKPIGPEHGQSALPMTITTEVRAVGRDLRYRISDGRLSISRKNHKDKPLILTPEEFRQMVREATTLMEA